MTDKQKEIYQALCDIIVDRLGFDAQQLKPESKLREDFGADSLDAIDVAVSLEHQFDIFIPDDRLQAISGSTLEDISVMVEQYIEKKSL